MYRVFQNFIDQLAAADDVRDFSNAMATIAAGFDLSSFAYLALPRTPAGEARLISTYPEDWITRYFNRRYDRIDPVIATALKVREPFKWGATVAPERINRHQQQVFDEAAHFGVRAGITVPIHDDWGPIAALTFAGNDWNAALENAFDSQSRVLQLIAMYFHANVRERLLDLNQLERPPLSARELECLKWAARGKSAWEIGKILGISRNTAASYIANAKHKLGVRTVVQAVIRLGPAIKGKQNLD